MDIMGSDAIIAFKYLTPKEAAHSVKVQAKSYWPEMVVEEDEGLDCFLYENDESKKIWDEGTTADVNGDNANMIYCLFRDKEVTLVYDKGTSSEEIVKRIRLNFLKLEVMAENPCCGLMVPATETESVSLAPVAASRLVQYEQDSSVL